MAQDGFVKLIQQFADNKDLKLELNNNQLVATNSKNQPKDSSLINYILANQENIKTAFRLSFLNEVNYKNFEDRLKEIFASGNTQLPDLISDFIANWIWNLPEHVKKNRKFQDLVLPGTHNSCATKINWNECPPHMNKFTFGLVKLPVVRSITENWTLNQLHDIQSQFRNGVRLFDLRVAKDNSNSFYIAHSFYLCRLDECFVEFGHCIKNSKEIIVINLKIDHPFKRFFTENDIKTVYEQVKNFLGEFILPANVSLKTIDDIYAQNRRIIFFMNLDHNQFFADPHGLIRLQSSHEIWLNEEDPQRVVARLKESPINKNNCFCYASFNSTPSKKSVVKGLFTADSNIKRSLELQEYFRSYMHEATVIPCGITFDCPNYATIQSIIAHNYK